VEVARVTRNYDGVEQRACRHHDSVNCERCVDVFYSSQRDTSRLGRLQRGYNLARRKDFFANVCPPSPPLSHNGQRNDDSRSAYSNQPQKPCGTFLSALC
jgi:hypothetical protein